MRRQNVGLASDPLGGFGGVNGASGVSVNAVLRIVGEGLVGEITHPKLAKFTVPKR